MTTLDIKTNSSYSVTPMGNGYNMSEYPERRPIQ